MDVNKIMAKAVDAAHKAGKEQLKKLQAAGPAYTVHNVTNLVTDEMGPAIGTMLDVCGNAYLTISGTDAFVRAAKKQLSHDDSYLPNYRGDNWSMWKGVYKGYTLHLDTGLLRQEFSVNEKAMYAAQEALKEQGVNVRVRSYID